MTLSGRTLRGVATNKNPRITREARAEHALLQAQAVELGQLGLRQSGIAYETTSALHGRTNLGRVTGSDEEIVVTVTARVRINPRTTAVIGLETK